MHAGTADVVNVALVVGFDAAILYFMGFKALMYLLVGVVLGGGLHPMAGHLIAEHYMFLKVSHPPQLACLVMDVSAFCTWVMGVSALCKRTTCHWQRLLLVHKPVVCLAGPFREGFMQLALQAGSRVLPSCALGFVGAWFDKAVVLAGSGDI